MNNNFEILKKETSDIVKNYIGTNVKMVLDYLNTISKKFNSSITVRKNMSVNSFVILLNNSSTAEEFKAILNQLDTIKDFEIYDKITLQEDIEFNEKYKDDKDYETMKEHYNSAIQLNDNLFVIEYK